MRWVLGGSIALNLVFIGLFAGAALRHVGGEAGAGPDHGKPNVRGYAAPYVQALPRETRRALGKELRKKDGAKRIGREARKAMYRAMVEAVRADPFDASAVQDVLKAQSDATQDALSAAQTLWAEEITKMSAAQRASYADRLEDLLARRGKPRKKGDGKPQRD
jgi:uncharacterized membrane protein